MRRWMGSSSVDSGSSSSSSVGAQGRGISGVVRVVKG